MIKHSANLKFASLSAIGASMMLAMSAANAEAVYQPAAEQIADNVYAIIGPTDARTYENHGMNANYGFIVTENGVILIDSGPSSHAANLLEQVVAETTDQPIRWVVNVGVQDHRWLGNQYFLDQGAEVIAFSATVDSQNNFADEHMNGRLEVIEEKLDDTTPATASISFKGEQAAFELGGYELVMELTNAHFPGDAMVYLPEDDIVFTGDLVYIERLLGIHPFSSPQNGYDAFQRLEEINPAVVVAGHGGVTDMETARRDTGNYYDFLVNKVGAAAFDFEPITDVMERYEDMEEFKHLEHYDSWHPTNVNRTFIMFEAM